MSSGTFTKTLEVSIWLDGNYCQTFRADGIKVEVEGTWESEPPTDVDPPNHSIDFNIVNAPDAIAEALKLALDGEDCATQGWDTKLIYAKLYNAALAQLEEMELADAE